MIRSYDDIFAVDGIPMLTPDIDMEISETDIDDDDSGRDESKIMHRFVAREDVRTWSFSYAVLDKEDYEYIKSLFRGKPEFSFTYEHAKDGTPLVATAYCSKKSAVLHDKGTGLYKGLKFNIIEC